MRKHTFLFIIFLYVGICIQVKATGGNVIHFVSKIENLNFKDTLEMLT